MLEGWSKFQGDWLHGTPLLHTLDGWVDAHKTYQFFLPVINTARAHPKIFGTLITAGELVIGASMVLGPAHAPRRVPGRAMLFSFAFGAGQGPVPPGNALLMGAIFAALHLRAPRPRARLRPGPAHAPAALDGLAAVPHSHPSAARLRRAERAPGGAGPC